MDDTLHTILAGWGDFYLIAGTAAATLTGLQFVVQTLIASNGRRAFATREPEAGIAAFGTPTVVHFSLALLVSGALTVPWPGIAGLRATLGALGSGALVYAGVVFRRTLRQRTYAPVLEDWIWHVLLPAVAYGALLLSAALLRGGAEGPLLTVGAATLLLLCVGIHNAWDSVAYLTVSVVRAAATQGRPVGRAVPPEERP